MGRMMIYQCYYFLYLSKIDEITLLTTWACASPLSAGGSWSTLGVASSPAAFIAAAFARRFSVLRSASRF